MPGPEIEDCELTHLSRESVDVALAIEQHTRYEQALGALGCRVQRLPALSRHPDAVFVEDAAVVLPEVAVVTRPGAASRRGETPSVEEALRQYRPIARIEAPGTLDGGDVLRMQRTLFVGLSGRTDRGGLEQFSRIAGEFGYRTVAVEVVHCLHLKTAVTAVGPGSVLLNPNWIDRSVFDGMDLVEVDPAEPFAANVVRVADSLLAPASAPRTHAALEAAGMSVMPVDQTELAKAEGGLTCCSLIFEA